MEKYKPEDIKRFQAIESELTQYNKELFEGKKARKPVISEEDIIATRTWQSEKLKHRFGEIFRKK